MTGDLHARTVTLQPSMASQSRQFAACLHTSGLASVAIVQAHPCSPACMQCMRTERCACPAVRGAMYACYHSSRFDSDTRNWPLSILEEINVDSGTAAQGNLAHEMVLCHGPCGHVTCASHSLGGARRHRPTAPPTRHAWHSTPCVQEQQHAATVPEGTRCPLKNTCSKMAVHTVALRPRKSCSAGSTNNMRTCALQASAAKRACTAGAKHVCLCCLPSAPGSSAQRAYLGTHTSAHTCLQSAT